MKKEWKNHIKAFGYLVLIMLLLFSSLPLSGVFADDEISQTEIFIEEYEQSENSKMETSFIDIEEVTEVFSSEEINVEEQTTEVEMMEENATEESLPILDSYLFSGKETIIITRNDGDVINQGKAFARTYFVSLNNYHDCMQNQEGNHLLQASYTVYQGDNVMQRGTLMFDSTGGDSFHIEYPQTGEYTIEIKASAYEESNAEYVWIADRVLGVVTDSVDKTALQLQGSIEKEGHFSYREDYGRSVALSLWLGGFEMQNDGDICYSVSSSNEAVIKLEKEQETYSFSSEAVILEIVGVGQAELIIQPMEHDFYTVEELVIPIIVENSAVRDEDYCIVYTDAEGTETVFTSHYGAWQSFLEEKEHWLNGSVRIQLSETGAHYYAGLGSTSSQDSSTVIEDQQLFLSEEASLQQYDFWCSNLQKNTLTKGENGGIRTFSVGIDKTAPENTQIAYNQNYYEPTSTDTTKYYSENFVVSGSFEDALSGVKNIEYTTQADLGESAQWKSIQNVTIDETKVAFELVLEQGSFTGIAIRATDYAGNVSKPFEIKNKAGEYLTVTVDKIPPKLSVLSKTEDNKSYQGEWTNHPITIWVQESSQDASLSGIQSIQYQYVSIGSEYQSDSWEELPSNGILEIGNDETVKTDKNGIYFFRAITNTGVVTAVEAQQKNAVRIRLQQNIPEKAEIIELAPELKQNQTWYNKKTGVPVIEFAYPEYDNGVKSLEYKAPITIHTRLKAKLADEKEMAPVYQTATIGISNDTVYQNLCANENITIEDNLQDLTVDFSYDKDTGYAEDGIYQLEYWITDAAGNESGHDVYTYQIDTHEPEALEVIVDGTLMREDATQTIIYERFYQSTVNGSASADFGVSGKGAVKLMLAESIGDWEKNKNWIQSDSFSLLPCNRGCIYMIAEDAAGNQSVLRTQGIVVDNQPPTGENGGKFISIQTKANENNFYNKDIEVKLTASDLPRDKGFSALKSVTYHIGSDNKELFSFTKALPGKEELLSARSFEATQVVDAAVCEGNDIYVEITATDRCGNTATSREELKIDVTEPKVEITFDQNEPHNGCFYQTTRIATISIEELNFDSQGIEVTITRDNEPYMIPFSEWQSDGISHWTTVAFLEDGDYTMTVSCTDLADNTSKEVSVEPFTIDLTKPEIEISYDNNEAKNDVYFRSARVAEITVKEHNFREEDFILTVEPHVLVSAWQHQGDEHRIQISFMEDNHYRFSCTCTDLAGNVADEMQEQDFYIDSIAPQIVIHGVEDGSANAGEINPVVAVYDTNHNKDAVSITVTTGVGKQVPLTIQMQGEEQGCSYILTGMSEKEDNVYFLKVVAQDMAGNESELTYRFSLNRNGSTYDLTEISQITNRVYNRFEQLSDIRIIEMNVDEIESYSIYITRNGKMLSCQETQERPLVDSDTNVISYYVEAIGDEKKGFTNCYIFYQENFSEEGIYRITCYSKDRAGNEMNNTLEEKKAEVSFVVDNTAPKVVIDGIEEGGIYNEEFQTVNIMVQDNFCLAEACFTLVNQDGEELQSWDYMELAGGAGETVSITIPSLAEKQSLLYCVSDAAGNGIVLLPDSEEAPKGFLVTTNPWLRFISSPIKVAGAICTVIGLLGTVVIVLVRIKRRKMTK